MIGSPSLPVAPGYPDVRIVEISPTRVLAVDGAGMPEAVAADDPRGFQAAIQTLYPIAYTLHFALKRRGVEARVGTLEALWDVAPGTSPESATWTAIMPVPAEATGDEVEAAIAEVRRKKAPPAIDRVALVPFDEGLCAEIVHIGRYDAEQPTIARLHVAIAEAGCEMRGRHHEIYLSDPRRTPDERLRTVIRQPIARKAGA